MASNGEEEEVENDDEMLDPGETLHSKRRKVFLARARKQIEIEKSKGKNDQPEEKTMSNDMLKQMILIEETRGHYPSGGCFDFTESFVADIFQPAKRDDFPHETLNHYALWVLEMMKKYQENPMILELGSNILYEIGGLIQISDINWDDRRRRKGNDVIVPHEIKLAPLPSPEIVDWTVSYSGPFWIITHSFLRTILVKHIQYGKDNDKEANKDKLLRLFHASTRNIASMSKQNNDDNNIAVRSFYYQTSVHLHIWINFRATSDCTSSLIWDTDDAMSSLTWGLSFHAKHPMHSSLQYILDIVTFLVPNETKTKTKAKEKDKEKDKAKKNTDVSMVGGNFSRYWQSQKFLTALKSYMPSVLHHRKMKFTPLGELVGNEIKYEYVGYSLKYFSKWLGDRGKSSAFRHIFRQEDFLGSIIEGQDILVNDSNLKKDKQTNEAAAELILYTFVILSEMNDEEYTKASLRRLSVHIFNFDVKIFEDDFPWNYQLCFEDKDLGQIKTHFKRLRTNSKSKEEGKSEAETQNPSVEKEKEAVIKIVDYLENLKKKMHKEREQRIKKIEQEQKEYNERMNKQGETGPKKNHCVCF